MEMIHGSGQDKGLNSSVLLSLHPHLLIVMVLSLCLRKTKQSFG
jgi:hypothetical protein